MDGDGDPVAPDGLGLLSGHRLGFVEKGVLHFLGRGLGLAFRLGQMENRLEQADLLLQLGDVAGLVDEELLERGGIVGQGSDVHGLQNMQSII